MDRIFPMGQLETMYNALSLRLKHSVHSGSHSSFTISIL